MRSCMLPCTLCACSVCTLLCMLPCILCTCPLPILQAAFSTQSMHVLLQGLCTLCLHALSIYFMHSHSACSVCDIPAHSEHTQCSPAYIPACSLCTPHTCSVHALCTLTPYAPCSLSLQMVWALCACSTYIPYMHVCAPHAPHTRPHGRYSNTPAPQRGGRVQLQQSSIPN